MIPVDAHTMSEIAPRFSGDIAARQAAIIDGVGAVLSATLDRYAINNPLRIAHFLGQTCHESAGFRTTEEFASGEAYEGRKDLGNTKTGDGVRYKGRGLLQLTGRANYHEVGELLNVDLEGQPTLAAEPVLSLKIACEFWKKKKINAACDDDNLDRVTRLVNGGVNGIEERRVFTTKAKNAIARLQGIQLSGAQAATKSSKLPVLHRGSRGDAVVKLQKLLRTAGFAAVAVDGDFGPGTEVAVVRFQTDKKLDADGIVGDQTWAKLQA
jgi:putative chitinase